MAHDPSDLQIIETLRTLVRRQQACDPNLTTEMLDQLLLPIEVKIDRIARELKEPRPCALSEQNLVERLKQSGVQFDGPIIAPLPFPRGESPEWISVEEADGTRLEFCRANCMIAYYGFMQGFKIVPTEIISVDRAS